MSRLRKFRLHLDISQGELAERLGVKQPNLSHWEKGRHNVTEPYLSRLEEMGLNLHWLETGEGDMLRSTPLDTVKERLPKYDEEEGEYYPQEAAASAWLVCDSVKEWQEHPNKEQKAKLLGVMAEFLYHDPNDVEKGKAQLRAILRGLR